MAAWWHYEDHRYQIKQMIAAAGLKPEEVTMQGVTYDDMRPGCFDPKARLDDMTANHVQASLCFPNYPRFCGQLFAERKDLDLSKLCVEAYNDWMVEEWCGGSEGRLIPLCIVPLWDVELAAAEIRRNAARGVRAVAWSELPAWLGLPSIHSGEWDPFFRACEETGTVICMHIGSGTKTVTTSADAPTIVTANMIAANSAASMIDWLFSGKLAQFPNLKLLYAECQIGWIPYFVERADDTWETHQWAQGEARSAEPPSVYYHRQIHSCFFKDTVGVELLRQGGRRQRDVRDRLPAPGRHVSRITPDRRAALRSPRRRRPFARSLGTTPSGCSTWTSDRSGPAAATAQVDVGAGRRRPGSARPPRTLAMRSSSTPRSSRSTQGVRRASPAKYVRAHSAAVRDRSSMALEGFSKRGWSTARNTCRPPTTRRLGTSGGAAAVARIAHVAPGHRSSPVDDDGTTFGARRREHALVEPVLGRPCGRAR